MKPEKNRRRSQHYKIKLDRLILENCAHKLSEARKNGTYRQPKQIKLIIVRGLRAINATLQRIERRKRVGGKSRQRARVVARLLMYQRDRDYRKEVNRASKLGRFFRAANVREAQREITRLVNSLDRLDARQWREQLEVLLDEPSADPNAELAVRLVRDRTKLQKSSQD